MALGSSADAPAPDSVGNPADNGAGLTVSDGEVDSGCWGMRLLGSASTMSLPPFILLRAARDASFESPAPAEGRRIATVTQREQKLSGG